MSIKMKAITYVDQGLFDMGVLIDNFNTVYSAVNDLIKMRYRDGNRFLSMYPAAMSYAIEEFGGHVLLEETFRSDMMLKQVYITAGAEGDDTEIDISVDGYSLLEKPVMIKSSEGRGKVVIGMVRDHPTITKFDKIMVYSTSNRRITVSAVFKGVEY